MQKKKAIEIFKSGHKEFQSLLKLLTPDQLANISVLENWTVKDIISHLSAWNFAQAKEIDNILSGKPTWRRLYKTVKDQNEFNKKAVEERKNRDIQEIIREWEKSFDTLIKRLENLTDEEWNNYPNLPLLFHYEKEGLSDEGRHAKEVKRFIKSHQ